MKNPNQPTYWTFATPEQVEQYANGKHLEQRAGWLRDEQGNVRLIVEVVLVDA